MLIHSSVRYTTNLSFFADKKRGIRGCRKLRQTKSLQIAKHKTPNFTIMIIQYADIVDIFILKKRGVYIYN